MNITRLPAEVALIKIREKSTPELQAALSVFRSGLNDDAEPIWFDTIRAIEQEICRRLTKKAEK